MLLDLKFIKIISIIRTYILCPTYFVEMKKLNSKSQGYVVNIN